MRKYLAAGALALALPATALAADIPVRRAPPVVAPVYYSWTGCYIGGNVGVAWRGHDGWRDDRFGLAFDNDNDNGRFMVGGQVGCNYQFDRFVIGAEWDADWTGNRDRDFAARLPNGQTIVASSSSSAWVSTLAARFGVAFDRVLLYGKAGVGWVGAEGDVTIANLNTGRAIVLSGGGSRTGWVVGAGVEWAVYENWSVKLEYDFLGRSGDTFTVPLGSPFLAGDTFHTGDRNIQMVKLGVNWRFNWGAPAAPVYTRY
jgi:outer membrane immunogenic protein